MTPQAIFHKAGMKTETRVKDIAREIRATVESLRPLSRLTPDQISFKASPDNWSKKEILGHLIDSAANNHQRFVRAAYNAAFVIKDYLRHVRHHLNSILEKET